jgi:hypothetical protein
MEGYDNLRDSITFIRGWYMESAAAGADPLQRFKDELGVDYGNERVLAVDDHRFRVSRFFVKTRKLVQGGYLSETMVASALGGQAIEDVFLKMVDPLDSIKADHNYGLADKRFYTALLDEHPRGKRRSM